MKKEFLRLPRTDEQVPIYLCVYTPDLPAKAIVQIAHGMAEHMERYDETARFLCSHGYMVALHNHRAHGREWPEGKLGHFADKKGWDKLILDMHTVMTRMKNDHPGIPYILLGHSMGSFAAREFTLRYGKELTALILSGTGRYSKGTCLSGMVLSSLFPGKKPAPFLFRLVFQANNRFFFPVRTAFDWLSRDMREIARYIGDPRCGFALTGASYKAFFKGLYALSDRERLADLPFALPVYLISGDKDPIGRMGRSIGSIAQDMQRFGHAHVTVRLYRGARHELFHEINRQEVWMHLISWLDHTLNNLHL